MSQDAHNEQFASLYSKEHLGLLRYVLTLVPNRSQAEDIVQETARLLWKKFAQYDPEKPFGPWARKFAYFEALKHRKKQAIHYKYFTDELVEDLAREREEQDELFDAGRKALDNCLAKLDEPSSQLLMDRYGREFTLKDLAQKQGRSANSLYMWMHRIRQKLVECVNRKLAAEGWTPA